MSPAPLNLDELALLRSWLHGSPVDALADYCGDKEPAVVLAELRNRLLLKARRLHMDWGGHWLDRPSGSNGVPKVLKRLDWLQQADDIQPDTSHPLAYWLIDEWLVKLAPLEAVTVADWLAHYRSCNGKAWWMSISGLGATTAKAIEALLGHYFPTEMVKMPPQVAQLAYAADTIPLGQFLLPEELDGSQGLNRSANTPYIPATDDYQAIENWLARLEPGSHTYRSYRREAERLLLWAILAKQKAVSSLDMVDMRDYRAFLADPQPAHLWVGAPKKRGQTDWKPFTGPLSLRSRRFSETVLNGLFTFLVSQHYLQHNPLTALAKLTNPSGHKPIDTNRSFNEAQWLLIQTFLDGQVANTAGAEKLKWLRTRMVIQLAYGTGLRLHELANAKLGDLEIRQRQGNTQHWLMVLGKGQKLRDVPIPLPLYLLLAETYQQLTGRQLGSPPPSHPIIPPLRGSASTALTPLAIHKTIKEAFAIAANTIKATDPETASRLLLASTHWLRHTHGSIAVGRNIPLTMIRDNLGHSNIATTSNYVHSDNDVRHDAFVEWFSEIHKSVQ